MTPPKNAATCPICKAPQWAVGAHLKKEHCIANREELDILVKLAYRRPPFNKEPCPVSGCEYWGSRLDAHLPRHNLSEAEKQDYGDDLRWDVALRQLAALRARRPSPAMTSTLDVRVTSIARPPTQSPSAQVSQPPSANTNNEGCARALAHGPSPEESFRRFLNQGQGRFGSHEATHEDFLQHFTAVMVAVHQMKNWLGLVTPEGAKGSARWMEGRGQHATAPIAPQTPKSRWQLVRRAAQVKKWAKKNKIHKSRR